MSDRVRNALQISECGVYISQPEATASFRPAVDAVESAASTSGIVKVSSGKLKNAVPAFISGKMHEERKLHSPVTQAVDCAVSMRTRVLMEA